MIKPKVLHIDIEISPMIAAVWGIWQQNVHLDNLQGRSEVLCAAMSWEDKDEVEFVSVWGNGRKAMLKKIHKRLSEADIVVTYNGDKFDLKILNMEFASVGLSPPAPFKSVDLLKTVKRRFRLPSNKMDFVLKYFNLGAKMEHYGPMLWIDVVNKDPAARKIMEEYNRKDVTEMKKLFKFLLGWGIVGMPNMSAFLREERCPECGSNHYQHRGTRLANMLRYKRYQCNDCGHWFRSNKAVDKDRPALMVPIR